MNHTGKLINQLVIDGILPSINKENFKGRFLIIRRNLITLGEAYYKYLIILIQRNYYLLSVGPGQLHKKKEELTYYLNDIIGSNYLKISTSTPMRHLEQQVYQFFGIIYYIYVIMLSYKTHDLKLDLWLLQLLKTHVNLDLQKLFDINKFLYTYEYNINYINSEDILEDVLLNTYKDLIISEEGEYVYKHPLTGRKFVVSNQIDDDKLLIDKLAVLDYFVEKGSGDEKNVKLNAFKALDCDNYRKYNKLDDKTRNIIIDKISMRLDVLKVPQNIDMSLLMLAIIPDLNRYDNQVLTVIRESTDRYFRTIPLNEDDIDHLIEKYNLCTDYKINGRILEYYGDAVYNLLIIEHLNRWFFDYPMFDLTNIIGGFISNMFLLKFSLMLLLCGDLYDVNFAHVYKMTTKEDQHNVCSDLIEALVGVLFLQYGPKYMEKISSWLFRRTLSSQINGSMKNMLKSFDSTIDYQEGSIYSINPLVVKSMIKNSWFREHDNKETFIQLNENNYVYQWIDINSFIL